MNNVKRTFSYIGLLAGIVFLLSGCDPRSTPSPDSHQESPEPTLGSATLVPTVPVVTTDQATLFQTGFDQEYPLGAKMDYMNWESRFDEGGNGVFCNLPSDDWNSFPIGKQGWENYAIELRMQVIGESGEQFTEVFFRLNERMDGYRASLGNHQWASIGFYPPATNLGGESVDLPRGDWFQVRVHVYQEQIEYYLNDELVVSVEDDRRSSGEAGVGASGGTLICLDDLHIWALDSNGNPVLPDPDLVIEPYDGTATTIEEKIANRNSIPVFYPWAGKCQVEADYYFDCDSEVTPYGLIWTASGINPEIDSLEINVEPGQTILMSTDPDTLFLISEEWHYWNTNWRNLSPDSRFYLDETFQQHEDSEYGHTKMINFLHPEWPAFLAEKFSKFKEAGYDGVMLDWWHDWAGNGRPEAVVQEARMEIVQAIREEVGEDFIIMGNVGWWIEDPAAPYMSGVFLELWNMDASIPYSLTYEDEDGDFWVPSIERMEDLLIYWDQNLAWPAVVAFEPFKVTRGDFIEDRTSEENLQYARLYAAMGVVIPEHGYVLYADNNLDWDGGDHQHAYYDIYHTDLGKPTSQMIEVTEGVAYKIFEKGFVIYNRTDQAADVELPDGSILIIEPLTGIFLVQ